MRRSLNSFIPFVTAILLLVITPLFLFSSTYLFYRFTIRQLASQGFWVETDLSLLKQEAFKVVLFQVIIAIVLFVVIYLVLFIILERSIFSPLSRLRETIAMIQRGDEKATVDIKADNEIGDVSKSFNEMIKELRESHIALQEAKTTLEIRVRARTKEIEEVAKSLDHKVKERTKELQEKLRELERFHRLAVGRELKMIELKKEIKELKKRLSKYEKTS